MKLCSGILISLLSSLLTNAQNVNYGTLWTQVSCVPGIQSQSTGVNCVLSTCSGTTCDQPQKIVYGKTYPVTLNRTCTTSSTSGCSALFCEYATASLVPKCTSAPLLLNMNGTESTNITLSGGIGLSCGFTNGVVTGCNSGSALMSSSGVYRLDYTMILGVLSFGLYLLF